MADVVRDSTDGIRTVTIGANNRVNRQIYSPNGWLEVVETTDGTEVHATRMVIGHKPSARGRSLRAQRRQTVGSCRAAGLVRVGSESVGVG